MPELFGIALGGAVIVFGTAITAYARYRRRPIARDWAFDHHFAPCEKGVPHDEAHS